MEELYQMGISTSTIKSMLEINPNIQDMTSKEFLEKFLLLKDFNCNECQIINIVSSNPMFLDRTNEKIIELANELVNLGFDCLNVLFDSNPYILNLEVFEIKKYISNRKSHGERLDEIVDDLDSHPYLFHEI